jgi:putative flippase GtrA
MERGVEFIKYFVASAVALAIDYGTYWALAAGKVLDPPMAAVVGYTVGLAAAYCLLKARVFTGGWLKGRRTCEAMLFTLSGLLGIGLTYSSVQVCIHLFGSTLHGAKISAIGISFFGVYWFRRIVVFRPQTEAERNS